ncbi:serine hydrolase [Methylobacterium frigidaeris]|uniref:serine hydrolase n=1 Tax=Methylobacterium frigidaeris TaxID=2038277 RepID=UPI001EE0BC36|nr:serine hydrolase [Methylobacterium frigidaeris]
MRAARLGMAAALWPAGAALSPRAASAADISQVGGVVQGLLDATASQGQPQGLAIGVSLAGGSQTWTGAAGFADAAGTQPLSADMQFRIGSATKTFTGTVVLRQVDQGVVGLNDPINKWVGDLAIPGGDQITVRNLLGMTSGIPDYLKGQSRTVPGITVLQEWANFTSPTGPYGNAAYTPEQLVAAAKTLAPNPIGPMNYSNTNFVVLGLIAQRASCLTPGGCQSIETLVNGMAAGIGLGKTIFPTGTGYTASHPRTMETVLSDDTLYKVSYGSRFDMTYVDPRVPWSAGAMLSSPADELRWVRQLATNNLGLLSPATQAQRVGDTTPGEVAGIPANYGLAIYGMPSVGTGGALLGHSGLIGGNTSSLFYNQDLDAAYAINFVGYQGLAQSWFPLYGATDAFGQYVYATGAPGSGAFSSVITLWALDRNVTLALTTQGSCSFGAAPAGGLCSGDNVRTTPLDVAGSSLVLQPSNRTIGGISIDPATGALSPTSYVRPSLATFGSGIAAVALQGAANLSLQQGAGLEIWGARSVGVAMTGQGNRAEIAGTVATFGSSSVGVRIEGSLNTLDVRPTGTVNGSDGPAITLAGTGNQALVAGTVATYGRIDDHGNVVEQVAIRGGGSSNRVEVLPGGTVTGDIAMMGAASAVRVDGSVAGSIRMAGTATTLSGTGLVSGTVGGGGTVAPGNSIGTLTVGSFLGQNTALVIETAADGRSDRLSVAGMASLAGGTLRVVPTPGLGGIYTALTAGAVQGSVDAVTTGSRVAAGARYTPVAVEVATANPFQTDAAARTAAADTLRTLDLFERRAGAFRTASAFGPPPGSGGVGTPGSAEVGGADSLRTWLSQRGPMAAGSRAMGAAIWASAYGTVSRLDADGPVPAIASSGGGVMVGADAEIAPNLLAGVMGAFSRTAAQASPGGYGSRLDADAYKIAAYGAVEVGPAVISASGLAGRGDLASLRPTAFAGMAGFARGRLDDTRFAGRLSAVTTLQAGEVRLMPRAAVTLLRVEQDPYTEQGLPASYASTIGRTRFALARPELSLALGRTILLSYGGWSGLLDAEIRAGIGRDLVLSAPDTQVRIPGFTPLSVRGFNRDAFVVPVGARAELQVANALSVFADYEGVVSRLGTDNTVLGGLRWRF